MYALYFFFFSVKPPQEYTEFIKAAFKQSCNYCQEIYEDQKEFEDHEAIHKTEEKPFTCQFCSNIFKVKSEVKSHEKTHIEDIYTCKVCSKIFLLKKSFLQHLMGPLFRRNHPCKSCDLTFDRQTSLKTSLSKVGAELE